MAVGILYISDVRKKEPPKYYFSAGDFEKLFHNFWKLVIVAMVITIWNFTCEINGEKEPQKNYLSAGDFKNILRSCILLYSENIAFSY